MTYKIDPATPTTIIGDTVRIRQIFLYLIDNAIKFTSRGHVSIAVSHKKLSADKMLLDVSVQDSGIGISQEKLTTLFEPFSQGNSSFNRQHGGIGLGLAVCKRLVELMGGCITVESMETVGSTFHFTIEVKSKMLKPTEILPTQRNSQKHVSHVRILLAEDNLVNQKIMLRMLEKLNHTADVASTGLEVLEKTKDLNYDLIFMDVHLPEIDGLETAKKIREQSSNKSVPIIIGITADTVEAFDTKLKEAGFNDCMSKPVKLEEIRGKLELWCR